MTEQQQPQQQQDVFLIEWSSSGGREQISTSKAIGDGADALAAAMGQVTMIADQVKDTAKDIVTNNQGDGGKPGSGLQEIEFTFGLKFDAEAGVFLAKAGIEASISVKMVWKP